MSKIDGALILMTVNGTSLVGITDNSFNYTVGTFETTTKDSNRHVEKAGGEDSGSFSFSGLYDPTGSIGLKDLLDLAKAKAAIPIVHGHMVAGGTIASSYGIITSIDWTNPKNEASGFSGTIESTGEITFATYADVTAPVLESAAVNNASPAIIRLTFSEPLDPNYKPASTVWTISPSKTISSYTIIGNKINITVSVAFGTGDTITIAYTDPGEGIRDTSGNELATFTAEAVTNNVTA